MHLEGAMACLGAHKEAIIALHGVFFSSATCYIRRNMSRSTRFPPA